MGCGQGGWFFGEEGVADVAEAAFGVFFEAALDECPGRGREGGEIGVNGEDGGQGVGDGFAIEEAFAGEEFVEYNAEGEDVGAFVDGFTAGLFGAHVAGGAQDEAGGGGGEGEGGGVVGIVVGGLGDGGDAEVEDLYDAIGGAHYVGGFQVAVDDAFFVGGFEGGGDLAGCIERFLFRQRATDGFALDELHDQRGAFGGFFEAVDLGDVGVVQRGEDFGFAGEAGEAFGVAGELGWEELDGYFAIESGVAGAPDFAHAAGADGAEDLIGADFRARGKRRLRSSYCMLSGAGQCQLEPGRAL
jgi:hypothetical protein